MRIFTPAPKPAVRYLDNATALKVAFAMNPDWWCGTSIPELKANLDLGGWYTSDASVRLGVEHFGCVRRFALEAASQQVIDNFLASL